MIIHAKSRKYTDYWNMKKTETGTIPEIVGSMVVPDEVSKTLKKDK